MNKSIAFLRSAEQELENLLREYGIYEQVKALESVIAAYRETTTRSIIPVSPNAVSVSFNPVQVDARVTRKSSGNFKNGITDFIRERGTVIRVADYDAYLKSQGHNPKQLSTTFQILKGEGVVQIHKINGSNNKGYYGLTEWFENGEPKPEYWSDAYKKDRE